MADWILDEPDRARISAELGRLGRRARRRLFWTVACVLASAGALTAWRARGVRFYPAQVVLRVTEGDLDPTTSPRAARGLREYVEAGALNASRLSAIAREHDLYAGLEDDPNALLTAMRADIQVDVFRNYFLEERAPGEPPRSARISIRYRGRDPQVALDVVRELGHAVEAFEQASRKGQAQASAAAFRSVVADLEQQLEKERNDLAVREARLASASAAEKALLRVEVDSLRHEVLSLDERLFSMKAQSDRAALRLRFEQQERGLRFEVVDASVDTGAHRLRRGAELVLTGIVGAILALPFCIIVVGAFDSRVYDLDDVRRLGLPAVGQVPRFRGDEVGSLSRRDGADGVK